MGDQYGTKRRMQLTRLAAGQGAVWSLNRGDGSVSRIDPNRNQVVATIQVGIPGAGGDIPVGEGLSGLPQKMYRSQRSNPRPMRRGAVRWLWRGRPPRWRGSHLAVQVLSGTSLAR
jgi:YVTN family beta-propeller protein